MLEPNSEFRLLEAPEWDLEGWLPILSVTRGLWLPIRSVTSGLRRVPLYFCQVGSHSSYPEEEAMLKAPS